MADDKVSISFDEECRIRVLDPEVFKHSETLQEDSKGFISKTQVARGKLLTQNDQQLRQQHCLLKQAASSEDDYSM